MDWNNKQKTKIKHQSGSVPCKNKMHGQTLNQCTQKHIAQSDHESERDKTRAKHSHHIHFSVLSFQSHTILFRSIFFFALFDLALAIFATLMIFCFSICCCYFCCLFFTIAFDSCFFCFDTFYILVAVYFIFLRYWWDVCLFVWYYYDIDFTADTIVWANMYILYLIYRFK